MDQRVRDHLSEKIKTFDGSLRSLGWVIADLDGVWSSETGWPEDVRKSFRLEWGTLEQIYAGALDRQANALDSEEERDIQAALKQIEALLPEAEERD